MGYLDQCCEEIESKRIFPSKNFGYNGNNTVCISLGSVIFLSKSLKDHPSGTEPNLKSCKITLKCGIYKNGYKVSDIVTIELERGKFRNIYLKKRVYNNFNFNCKHKCKVTVLKKSYFKVFKLKKLKFKSVKNGLKLSFPLVININSFLVFKVRNLKRCIKNNINLYFFIDLYIDNFFISNNYHIIKFNNYTDLITLSTGDYSSSCPHSFNEEQLKENNSDENLKLKIAPVTPNYDTSSNELDKRVCCCMDGRICHVHVNNICDSIREIMNMEELDNIGKSGIFNYLQILYYINNVTSCVDSSLVSLVTFAVSNDHNLLRPKQSLFILDKKFRIRFKYIPKFHLVKFSKQQVLHHQLLLSNNSSSNTNNPKSVGKSLCPLGPSIMYRHSEILSLERRNLFFIKIPKDFKILQLLYNSSLLSVGTCGNRIGTTELDKVEKINILNEYYSYGDINVLVCKYYNQLAKSGNSICLILRFTNYNDKNQYDKLVSYLTEMSLENEIKNSKLTRKLNLNVLLELLSPDFVGLSDEIREFVFKILVKNVTLKRLKIFFRQFVLYLKYDIDDLLFNKIVELVSGNKQLSVRFYYSLSSNLGVEKYKDYLIRYNSLLGDEISSLINLNNKFLMLFTNIMKSINDTRRRCNYRNYYLKLLLSKVSDDNCRIADNKLYFKRFIPLITDTNLLISSIDLNRTFIYKSANYPLILYSNTVDTNKTVKTSYTVDTADSDGSVDEKMVRIMLKCSDISKDELYVELLKIVKLILNKYKIDTNYIVTYNLTSIFNNLGYIQLLNSDQGYTTSNLKLNEGMSKSLENSFIIMSIMNYLFEIGDRNYENIIVTDEGYLVNVDCNYMFRRNELLTFLIDHLNISDKPSEGKRFRDKFKLIFKTLRKQYKLMINLLYASNIDIASVLKVEERFLLSYSGDDLDDKIEEVIQFSQNSHQYTLLFNYWYKFTNLFK